MFPRDRHVNTLPLWEPDKYAKYTKQQSGSRYRNLFIMVCTILVVVYLWRGLNSGDIGDTAAAAGAGASVLYRAEEDVASDLRKELAGINDKLTLLIDSVQQPDINRKLGQLVDSVQQLQAQPPAQAQQGENKVPFSLVRMSDDLEEDRVVGGRLQPPPLASRRPPVRSGNEADEAHLEHFTEESPHDDKLQFKEVCRESFEAYDYPDDLSTSIIICFRNEDLVRLTTTLTGILATTPPRLLDEILVLQDGYEEKYPTDEQKKFELANVDKVNKLGLPKVRTVINPTALGVGACRQKGAELAKAPVLMFLDSHVEPTQHWLEPLLQALTVPQTIVHSVVSNIFEEDGGDVWAQAIPSYGYWSWWTEGFSFTYKWNMIGDYANTNSARPFPSPAIPGGLFAIKRDHFFEYKGYDKSLQEWGAENLEIVLKEWMCGGQVLIAPCSNIGHLHRQEWPFGSKGSDHLTMNFRRILSVWLDKKWEGPLFQTHPEFAPRLEEEVRERREELAELNCKDFSWYVENVDFTFGENMPLEYHKISNVASAGLANVVALP